MEVYVNAGLAVEASNPSGIVFQLDWGTKQFNAFLCRLFPTLFAYFDTITPDFGILPDKPDLTGIKQIEYSLPYILLQKEYRKYKIIDDTHPIATKYKECLSGDISYAGFRAKGIFIGWYLCPIVLHVRSNTAPTLSHQGTSAPSSLRSLVLPRPFP